MENFNVLDENEFKKLSEHFIKNLNGPEILEKVHPKLKTIYENRALHYSNHKELHNQLSKQNKNLPILILIKN
jgi:hypothetical protein